MNKTTAHLPTIRISLTLWSNRKRDGGKPPALLLFQILRLSVGVFFGLLVVAAAEGQKLEMPWEAAEKASASSGTNNIKATQVPTGDTKGRTDWGGASLPELTSAADWGNSAAQCLLADKYFSGDNEVAKDRKEAAWWYRLAAEQGVAQAQFRLGCLYYRGEGDLPNNKKEAARWYRLAAEQGHAKAQFSLGFMYDVGEGAPKNKKEAVKWFRMSAEQGFAAAQTSLGYKYDRGEGGLAQSFKEAFKWYRLAAEQGDAVGQRNLASLYELGQGTRKDLKEAVKWYKLSAEKGDANSIKALQKLGSH